jgi:Flp pilus assembly pilin Flp
MLIKLSKLIRDRRGAGLTEYIILVGVVALVGLIGYRIFGTSVRNKVQQQATDVGSIAPQ